MIAIIAIRPVLWTQVSGVLPAVMERLRRRCHAQHSSDASFFAVVSMAIAASSSEIDAKYQGLERTNCIRSRYGRFSEGPATRREICLPGFLGINMTHDAFSEEFFSAILEAECGFSTPRQGVGFS